ncbi:MAG TPA: hypothetical protein VFG49_03355 [Dyella sp.]|uniref:hypothetical protein n=1 Tax=Dyella sp. TaxID=1869338 RepID=UPI002D767D5A|nr:hypothetical protein [Dyella sp.]HET6552550.1 hypothetical protein [Dyella sp.]
MKILLGFVPFFAFAVASALGYSSLGLIAGAVVSAAMLVWNKVSGRSLKLLEVGSCLLFAALAVYAIGSGASLSVGLVRLCVDGGLLLIALASVLIGRPFTIDYAKESVAPELWSSPRFLQTNRMISLAWAAAFAIIVVADVALWKGLMTSRHVVLVVAGAIYAAIKFTTWCPAQVRKQSSAS